MDGKWTGYILGGKTIPGGEPTTDENGDVWVRLDSDIWVKAYGPGGLFPPPTPEATPGVQRYASIPEKIDLSEYGFVLHNMGRHGFYVQDGGFVDQDGDYCPGGNYPCEGRTARHGMTVNNLGYIRDMLVQFNSETGRVLEMYFYDPSNPSPYMGESKDFGQWYRYGIDRGNGLIEVHFGIKTEDYNEPTREQVLFEPMLDLQRFLMGDYTGVLDYDFSGEAIPTPLQALPFPSKVYWR